MTLVVPKLDLTGQSLKKRFSDYEGRIFQHEYDHLDKVLRLLVSSFMALRLRVMLALVTQILFIDRLGAAEKAKIKPDLDKLVAKYHDKVVSNMKH
jgi:peptide deformylase